jgi:hypothetical protein
VTSKIIAFTIKKNHTGSIHFPNLLYPSSVGKFEGQNMLDLQTESAISFNFNQIFDGQSDKFRFNPLGKSYLFQKGPFQEPA